jgi:hypothetical protein
MRTGLTIPSLLFFGYETLGKPAIIKMAKGDSTQGADGHTVWNAPVRPPKLSGTGPGSCWMEETHGSP